MGFLKFLVPFLGGAVAAAAVGLSMQMKREDEEEDKQRLEVDAEFVEKTDGEEGYHG